MKLLNIWLGSECFYWKLRYPKSRFSLIICKMSTANNDIGLNETNLFKGDFDRFFGVSVSSVKEPKTDLEFPTSLQSSIVKWREKNVRAVWMKVYLEHSYWIPTLVGNGFTYHHAKPAYVTMVKWLPDNESNQIPSFAHNTLGVGGFVVNEADELLVVRERFQSFSNWKLPGGYVEVEENLSDAAVREVKEETGIESEFVSILAFRHMHKANFGCSDIYFIVILKPKTNTITMCKRELADCQWMKLTEYLDHPEVHENNKFFAKCYLEGKTKGIHLNANFEKFRLRNFTRDQVIYYLDSEEPCLNTCNSDKEKTSKESDISSKI